MRAVLLAVLIGSIAAPALADPCDPAWQRRANAEAMEREAERARAAALDREARAREQRARTEATIRAMQSGELAGGYSGATTPWRAPEIVEPRTPSVPPSQRTPMPEMTEDAARMDALMAQAMARSTARVRAMTADSPR